MYMYIYIYIYIYEYKTNFKITFFTLKLYFFIMAFLRFILP